MSLDELFEGNGHLLLHGAGSVHVAGDVEELRPGVPLPPESGEPRAPPATDGGRHGDRLHVSDGRRAAEHP